MSSAGAACLMAGSMTALQMDTAECAAAVELSQRILSKGAAGCDLLRQGIRSGTTLTYRCRQEMSFQRVALSVATWFHNLQVKFEKWVSGRVWHHQC